MKWAAAILSLLTLGVFATACGNSSTGYSCSTSGNYSSDQCRMKLAESSCSDGGTFTKGSVDAGTFMLCCSWENCGKTPYDGPID